MKGNINIELITRCLSNERPAQRKLYDLTLPFLTLTCRRYLLVETDLKDALQETYISIFGNLRQYDFRKAAFKTWSTRIAINACLKCNQKRRRNGEQELIVNLHEPEITPEVLARLSNEDLVRWLRRMPRPYFEVFNFYVIDGFSHQEIAELLGIDAQLSRQRLARSRAWLKKRLPPDLRNELPQDQLLKTGLMMLPLAHLIHQFLKQ